MMEENTARVDEIETLEPETEVAEVPESYNGGAFVAGIVGGFLAYAVIGGAKKLTTFVQMKWAERSRKATKKGINKDEAIDLDESQDGSDEEMSDK